MKKVMELVRTGMPIRDIMPITMGLDETELESRFAALTDHDVEQLGIWIQRTLNVTGTEKVLLSGCALSIYSAATATESRRSMFVTMRTELGISDSQAYRNMAVWRRAGKTLLESPDLIPMFAAESLKILCGKHCPADALDQALEMARFGMFINIQKAKELANANKSEAVAMAASEPSETPEEIDQPIKTEESKLRETGTTEKCRRKFTGRVVEIGLKFLVDPDSLDQKAILDDFMTFANELSAAAGRQNPISLQVHA